MGAGECVPKYCGEGRCHERQQDVLEQPDREPQVPIGLRRGQPWKVLTRETGRGTDEFQVTSGLQASASLPCRVLVGRW